MKPTKMQKEQLRQLPGVDLLQLELSKTESAAKIPVSVVKSAARSTIETLRAKILCGAMNDTAELTLEQILAGAHHAIDRLMRPNLQRTINATGVIIHTNLGRSLLTRSAVEKVAGIAGGYSNLEYDITAGRRGSRTTLVEDLLCEISGAEAALAVNNNAGAVLLSLSALAKDREVIVSRGELVEIGGSFRIPDVMTSSGCRLKEVGTTNRTHLRDYKDAIGSETALLLKVHKSNYDVVGFTAEVALADLVALGNEKNLPVMEDLGSGTFIDFSDYGMPHEPTVQASVAAGTDLVTFSGDKLLGGPQAGIIVGHKKWLDKIKSNPMARALRMDKMCLAALEATLRIYRDPAQAVKKIPTLAMLTRPAVAIEAAARQLMDLLASISVPDLTLKITPCHSRAGGGSLPQLRLPGMAVAITVKGKTAAAIERYLRAFTPPIIGRIENDQFMLDVRTVQTGDFELIKAAIQQMQTPKERHAS